MFWKRGWPLAHRAPGAWPPEAKTALFQTLNEVISRAQEAPLSALAAAELLTALVVDFGYENGAVAVYGDFVTAYISFEYVFVLSASSARCLQSVLPHKKTLLPSLASLHLYINFSSTKANALGLPLEFHRAAHAAFQSERCLLETLRLGMDLLARAVQNATTVGNALMTVSSPVRTAADLFLFSFAGRPNGRVLKK